MRSGDARVFQLAQVLERWKAFSYDEGWDRHTKILNDYESKGDASGEDVLDFQMKDGSWVSFFWGGGYVCLVRRT